MRKLSFQEKILQTKRNEKKRIIYNALRGAARPWKLTQIQFAFERITDKRKRVEFFNDNIGRIFPVILDLVASGMTINEVERQMNLTRRMLWQWLKNKERLMEEVRAARRLRKESRVLADYFEPP